MTMASEMPQSAGARAKVQRLKAIAAIGSALRQQLNASRSLRQAEVEELMASIRKDMASLRKDLDRIFSETAVIRGRSVDLMEAFARERKTNAEALRRDLESYMSGLETSVANLLRDYSRTRDEMCIRGMDAREAFLKDVRGAVQALLQDAEKTIRGFTADRTRAGKPARAGDNPRRAAPGKPAAPKSAVGSTQMAAPAKTELAVPRAESAVESAKTAVPETEKSAAAKAAAPAAEIVKSPAPEEMKPAVAKTAAPAPATESAKQPAPAKVAPPRRQGTGEPGRAIAGKAKVPDTAAKKEDS